MHVLFDIWMEARRIVILFHIGNRGIARLCVDEEMCDLSTCHWRNCRLPVPLHRRPKSTRTRRGQDTYSLIAFLPSTVRVGDERYKRIWFGTLFVEYIAAASETYSKEKSDREAHGDREHHVSHGLVPALILEQLGQPL